MDIHISFLIANIYEDTCHSHVVYVYEYAKVKFSHQAKLIIYS